MVKYIGRFEIWLVTFDPTKDSEIQKTRPSIVISPNEINQWLCTLIIAPMTTSQRSYPSRIPIHFQNKDGQVALDQLRTIDKSRLVKKLGVADENTSTQISNVLVEMFSI